MHAIQIAHTLIESMIRDASVELFLSRFHPGNHWLRPCQKSVAACGDEFNQGFLLSFPSSGKYPLVPPTAKFKIIWNCPKIRKSKYFSYICP